jgi:hypothetical protein
VDLRKTQEEVANLRNEVTSKSTATANVTISPEVFDAAMRASLRVSHAETELVTMYEPPKKPELPEAGLPD